MWRERAKEIFKESMTNELCIEFGYDNKEEFFEDDRNFKSFEISYDMMLKLAKEVHNKACEEQKKLCIEYLDCLEDDKGIILNCPNAKFE